MAACRAQNNLKIIARDKPLSIEKFLCIQLHSVCKSYVMLMHMTAAE